jgi:hypothetical protein
VFLRLEAKIEALRSTLMYRVDIHQAKIQAMMETCLEKSETTDLDANTKEIRVRVGVSGSL